MKKEEKNQFIETLTSKLDEVDTVYFTDISTLNAQSTSTLRRMCFKRNITIQVVKNKLLLKAMEKSTKDFSPLYGILKDSTSLMFCENVTEPAKLIKEFRRKSNRPILKGAYALESHFIGDNQLDVLIALKSKEVLIGELISLLQSPARNVISALQSEGNKLAGILKTLSEKES